MRVGERLRVGVRAGGREGGRRKEEGGRLARRRWTGDGGAGKKTIYGITALYTYYIHTT